MIHHIYEHYHMHVKELIPLAPIKAFGFVTKFMYLFQLEKWRKKFVEMKKLSDYMNQQGDITVATFVPTIHGYYVSEIEEQNYCLLKGMRALERHAISLGSELSIFHKRGAFFPEEIEQLSRIGEWKALWEKGSID